MYSTLGGRRRGLTKLKSRAGGDTSPRTRHQLEIPRGTTPHTDSKASFHQHGREGGGLGPSLLPDSSPAEGRKEEANMQLNQMGEDVDGGQLTGQRCKRQPCDYCGGSPEESLSNNAACQTPA